MTEVSAQVRLLPTTVGGVDTVAKFFRALGDPTRLRLLEFLLHDEHTVTECVAHVGLSQSRVSTHLSCLADCGYVQVRRTGLGPSIGSYGWAGGMGSMWSNDPSNALVGVMLSTDAFAGPFPPPVVIQDFWTGAYTALDN